MRAAIARSGAALHAGTEGLVRSRFGAGRALRVPGGGDCDYLAKSGGDGVVSRHAQARMSKFIAAGT
ncbi:hypothetical protein Ari01nite_85620 [Paractinoplanes rishiriensis]|uniref:Uncharacterized protein n=1 Tax=Paractinoplanes rishiriensis TaxID=1050105 RepID=A0A919K9C6_9ACTN|nr:hypothetical protein Ari01nite_85620 [Actinoplanes rishiriensis]